MEECMASEMMLTDLVSSPTASFIMISSELEITDSRAVFVLRVVYMPGLCSLFIKICVHAFAMPAYCWELHKFLLGAVTILQFYEK
jgi:hypothetical protein